MSRSHYEMQALNQLRLSAAMLILGPGLSEHAARGFVRAVLEEARRGAGDAAFGDLKALGDLAEFLFVAGLLEMDGAL